LNEYSLDEYDFEILELQWATATYPIPIEGGPGGVCDAVCDFVSDTVDSACDFVSSSFDNAFDFISDSFDIVYNMLSDPYSLLTDPFGSAYDLFTETWDSFTDFCEDTWEDIEEFAEETWDSVCDAWDKFGQQLVMIAAVVVTSWIPGVNAVVAGAVIGALSAGLESGWDLKAMAVGAAAGAISSYAGGLGNSAAKLACNAGSSALKAGYESGWDLSEMGEAAVTGAATSYISGKFKANGWDSTTAGRFARNTTVSTINSCQRNGWNSDAVVNGVAGGVGNTVGEMAVGELDIDNPEAQKFVYSTVSSTTSQALVAAATGEDVMDAVTNGVARNAVTASLNTLTNQLYDELPEGEAYAKSEEYCRLATDAATKAVAAMVVNGADFDTAFEANLNANINNELMGQVQNNLNAKVKAVPAPNGSLAADVVADDTYNADYDGVLPTGNLDITDPGFSNMDAETHINGSTYQTLANGQLYVNDAHNIDQYIPIHPNDVEQGLIGDCYLMSSMAAVADQNPDAINNMIADNGDGTYTVTFNEKRWERFSDLWNDRYKPVEVTVDDDFPMKNGQPVFAQPGDGGIETWTMVTEKAYAKHFGDGEYSNIEGGWPDKAMEHLTGVKSSSFSPDNLEIGELSSLETDGNALTASTKHDWKFLGWDIPDTTDSHPLYQNGTLISDHAYYITDVDPVAETVTLQNPHGWDPNGIQLPYEEFQSTFSNIDANPTAGN
jgi:hypothetical protein